MRDRLAAAITLEAVRRQIPKRFASLAADNPESVPIVVRGDLEWDQAEPILEAIWEVDWSAYSHAYGSADDVENQLVAVTVGDEATRKGAWWNLWGNVHHQGTIYGAAVPAVPILAALARWRSYPDRAEAVLFLREVAAAPGVVVWRYGRDNEIVHDDEAQKTLGARLVAHIDRISRPVLDSWASDPPDVRRALVHLLTSLPNQRKHYARRLEGELPARFRNAWLDSFSERPSLEMNDEIDEYEHWVHSGE